MEYSLQYTKQAERDLQTLGMKNAKRIVLKLEFYLLEKYPLKFAKKLTGKYSYLYRYRIGEYRAIFHVNSRGQISMITIIHIMHRKNAYR
jgi:mRNA interferase RelE/StbE